MSFRQSLRWRLMGLIGVSVAGLWLLLAPWQLQGVRSEVQKSLDDRLAASARMVASLIRRQDLVNTPQTEEEPGSSSLVASPAFPSTLACKVSTLRGDLVALSQGAPTAVLDTETEGYADREVDGVQWRVYTLVADSLVITTADRLDKRDALMTSIVLAAASPFALALAGTLVILWFGIRHGFKPLRELSKDVAARDVQELEPLDWDNVPDEVKPLVAEINRLLLRVNQALQRERRFTGDAAHELRTPLTGIKTQLQVARLTQGKPAGHALDQAERALGNLQETLEQLLLLARIEGDAAFAGASRSSADEITSSALIDIAQKAQERQVRISYKNGPSEPVEAPAALAGAAVRNLLDNAIRFSPANGRVDINCSVDGEFVRWRIVDQGPGVPAGELDALTERFKRTLGSGGSGLGLAIVEAIVNRFGGSLRLTNVSPRGLEAQLRLRRAK